MGDCFFGGKKGVDFTDRLMSISQFDEQKKYARTALNLLKLIGIIIIWPTLGTLGAVKRFFWGRRHHDPIIMKLFKKALF